MDDYNGVSVVMRVNPDDADVLLNGRLIGAAYEFSSAGAALRLASRQNELVFKKRGFREEAIDLRTYSSRHITLKVVLQSESSPDSEAEIALPEGPPAYEAKSEPTPVQPDEKPLTVEQESLTEVTLTVIPEETAVYIDGKFWGLAPAEGKSAILRLPPGKYDFAAFKPGFRIYSKEVTVPKQDAFTLAIALQK